ncbi:MAG: S41 family peptidase [Pyrinomonadaceae bacterium]
MRRLICICVLFGLTAPLFSQTGKGGAVDPFSIDVGKTFSASRGPSHAPQERPDAFYQTPVTSDFNEALRLIQKNYVGRIDINELTKSSVNGMLSALDPHSSYYDPEEYNELLTDQRSEYFGIGATIVNYSSKGEYDTYVTSTFPESPAFTKRLRFGDKILAVDDVDVHGKSSLFVRNRVRGPIGTTVRLKIERPGLAQPFVVALKRGRVPQPSISDAYMLENNVGYIDLSAGFNYTTQKELEVALAELKSQGMTSLVLDLRDNTGGIVEQAVRVAEKFIPKGKTILTQKGRLSIDNRTWNSRNQNPLGIPLIVLVNEETASASEIVVGALQDYDRAFVVGENTFGKGLVQSVIDLPYGAGLTLTSAKYYTPSGRLIQRDYSTGNYEYYNHENDGATPVRAKRTASGRIVYEGKGIQPDLVVKAIQLSPKQEALLDPIFHFSRDLTAGLVPGLENYRVLAQVESTHVVARNEVETDDKLTMAFGNYLKKQGFPEAEQLLLRESRFIRERIRYNCVSAKYGAVTAQQVLLQYDPQLEKALDKLPDATKLARASKVWIKQASK